MPSKDDVLEALKVVMDPELGDNLVALNMVRDVTVDGGRVGFTLVLTTPACPLRHRFKKEAEAAVKAIPGVTDVAIEIGADTASARKGHDTPLLPGVRNVIVIGSGKGGVGKSTVAVNIALGLARSGARVGLMDADLYGPSVPIMLGLRDARPFMDADGKKLLPIEKHGLKIFSMGFLMGDNDALVWRGPMLHKAISQFLEDVDWGDLDYLVVDLPPGTGDIQISMTQMVPGSSAVVVTTPQDVAFADVLRAIRMFGITHTPVLGVIENMSTFTCPSCGKSHAIFGPGHIEQRASEHGVAHLGSIPLDPRLSPDADAGQPALIANPDGEVGQALMQIASTIAARQSQLNLAPRPV